MYYQRREFLHFPLENWVLVFMEEKHRMHQRKFPTYLPATISVSQEPKEYAGHHVAEKHHLEKEAQGASARPAKMFTYYAHPS